MTAIRKLVEHFSTPLPSDAEGFYYLASPYTSKSRQQTAEWVHQVEVLLPKIVDAFPKMTPLSPVACTDPLADLCDPEGGWYAYALRLLRHAEGFIIVTLDGWEDSRGIMIELGYARAKGIPISILPPDLLLNPREYKIREQMERLRQLGGDYEHFSDDELRERAIKIIEDDLPF